MTAQRLSSRKGRRKDSRGRRDRKETPRRRRSGSREDRRGDDRGRRRGRDGKADGRRRSASETRSRSRRRRSSTPKRKGGRRKDASEESRSSEESSSSGGRRKKKKDKKKKKKKKSASGDSDKDEIVHFDWKAGITLQSRYDVVRLLGDGTFGRCLLARDRKDDDREVAIKIIRDVKRYAENAKIEADILKDIRKADPRGLQSRSAIMFDTFMHGRHFCLVFEPCGVSLYDFLKRNDFRGFWMQDIQVFARQSLEALAFLHGRLKMTHTDLKPENILLASVGPPRSSEFPRERAWREANPSSKSSSASYVRPDRADIKLIDFGNATYETEHHSSIINTRQYRGPEVILELGWNELSDVWSMGCIIMELYLGELLFGTHENLEHLALMERTLEPLPEGLLRNMPKAAKEKYLAPSASRLNWPEGASSGSSQRHAEDQKQLGDMVEKHHASLASFVGGLLTMEPGKRPSAQKALGHEYLQDVFSD